ncbi:double-stranded RNA-binding protein Staufen homolog 2-like isoform X2 [Xenopus laevis]|uniref:Double-stranded RNA-binding protein Staufen homolog 2-like isoform X2 n=1 Tax=Xenopus laevis TaxID=8355 RepID=A0A8J1L0D2_XENLA|nr:double-stranded RNA-binding protein Staufen homolog 2-like isoform X2 [Xenopus laevis]
MFDIYISLTGSITPTVELNGLAMRRGEPAIYRSMDPKPLPNHRANYNYRGMYHQRRKKDTTEGFKDLHRTSEAISTEKKKTGKSRGEPSCRGKDYM